MRENASGIGVRREIEANIPRGYETDRQGRDAKKVRCFLTEIIDNSGEMERWWSFICGNGEATIAGNE